MSADEDNELRDLVAQTLENNGVLSKIRAQLRASVFLALEEQSLKENKAPLINKELQEFLNSSDGRIVASLIREFLEYFNLVFTQSVFSPETGESVQYNSDDRQQLCSELNLNNATTGPVLIEILRKLRSKKDESTINLTLAKEKFSNHDKDKNGKIDKETTCDVFMDLFPNFRRSLVERFVSEEFEQIDKNFNDEINFDDFKTFYQKLFDLCQSVVQHDTSLFVSTTNKMNTFTKSEKFQNSEDFSGDHFSVKSDIPSQTTSVNKFDDDDVNDAHDPFFDDPPSPTLSTPSSHKEKPPGDGGKTLFLDSLPALVTTTRGENQDGSRDSPLLSKLDHDINAKLAEIGLNPSNDDYDDDDFQSSGQKSGSEVSIDEEIEGDTSAYADLLCSTASGVSLAGNENITTDKTVSQMSTSGIDYLESLQYDSADKI